LAFDRSSNNLVIVGIIRHGSVGLDDAGYDEQKKRQKRKKFFDIFIGEVKPFA
jgi:hypothetical protein